MKKAKKLVLAKETVRRLTDNELKGIDGGAYSLFTCYENNSCYQEVTTSPSC